MASSQLSINVERLRAEAAKSPTFGEGAAWSISDPVRSCRVGGFVVPTIILVGSDTTARPRCLRMPLSLDSRFFDSSSSTPTEDNMTYKKAKKQPVAALDRLRVEPPKPGEQPTEDGGSMILARRITLIQLLFTAFLWFLWRGPSSYRPTYPSRPATPYRR